MTVVYYTCFRTKEPDEVFEARLNSLPIQMIEEIRRFKRWQDSLASLCGKLLLREGLAEFKVPRILSDVSYNECNKPYLKDNLVSFNISHSGNYVVCVVSNEVESIGIDIEQIKDIDINDFRKAWTNEEWKILTQGGLKEFYEYWTKKESIVKADGRGLELDLRCIDVRDSKIKINNKLYFSKLLYLHNDYVVHLSSTKNFPDVILSFIPLHKWFKS